MNVQHAGLIFTAEHIAYAKAHRDERPVSSAWVALLDTEPDDTIEGYVLAAFRYRFDDDAGMGEFAVDGLKRQSLWLPPGEDPVEGWTWLDELRRAFALAQVYELLREHPAFADAARWQAELREFISALSIAGTDAKDGKTEIIERAWLGVVQMAGAIMDENATLFQHGVDAFKQIIDEEIHPEGYFRHAVKVDPETESLANQLRGTQALVLMAEMAMLSGVDLWRYENRGVSVRTATAYPLYYYFYPEQWRWNGSEFKPSEGVKREDAKRLFLEHASFVEIASQRYEKPLKAATLVLQELRPVSNPLGGGYVTLTHGAVDKPKRRGLFRR